MKRVLAAVFGTVAGVVMLLNFKTHPVSVASVPVATAPTGDGGTGSGTNGGGAAAMPSSTSSSSPSSASPRTATYTGDSVNTQWGPVQVRITVSGGKIVKATAIVYPLNNPRDQEINAYAIPTLQQETVAANSAQIDMVSGATYTSEGYLGSLQSALNKAGL
jgi:uncharacterized protein with FMN-binding domain